MKLVLIFMAVIIVIVLAFLALRRTRTQHIDYSDPDKVLDMVEVYETFGEKHKASKALREAIKLNPGNAKLAARLEELNQ